ncbi:CG14424 [Drosophila busckii]|uniref:CG14424 n=1 Tax=Drosophila busckii TaxID=30019 RepID=A0A0M3QZ62_DROBS|nr:uncharacterized protein LOC108605047 [Drosophila busckii]ALC48819.1 CG14424 [Drosophila busckii]
MSKLLALLTIGLMLLASLEARQISATHRQRLQQQQQRGLVNKPLGSAHTRVFPGALAIKKLVLLKFKKIVPISLILLKSSNDNEAELVPVYPTDQLPENVQFIPTPNGIAGHKDVQAIAIPSELHEQLQISGLSNLQQIEALLASSSSSDQSAPMAEQAAQSEPKPEDALLQQPENDDSQLLEGVAAPMASTRRLNPNGSGNLRHASLPQAQTSVEEIPLLLYAATDGGSGAAQGRRFVAATHARRRQLPHGQQRFYY